MKLVKSNFQKSKANISTVATAKKKSCLRKNAILALVAGVAISGMNPAFAENTNNPEYDFDQVVITATRTEKSIKEVPAAVEVITKEEMDKRNIKRVGDALTSILGVYVRQTKGIMGTTDTILMRGFGNQKHVLVLMDGQPVNDGYSNIIDMANIPTENIERIEVMKGPNSALYGSNAMGGVVNIITKAKAEQQTIIKFGMGGQDTMWESISTNGSAGKLDYFFTAQGTSSDGYNVLTTGGVPSSDGKNGMNREIYTAKFIYHPSESDQIGLSAGKSRYRYFYENSPNNKGHYNEERWLLNYQRNFNQDSSLKFSYGQKDRDYGYSLSATSSSATPSSVTNSEIQYETRLSPKDVLIIGYAYKGEEADNSSSSATALNFGGKTKTHSLFFQDEHHLGDNTVIYLGGRYDDWSFYDAYTTSGSTTVISPEHSDNSFNPKLGITHKINEKMTLRSSIGTAFRTPNIFELARTWEGSSGTIYRNNPDLKPESATNYEIGLDYQINESLSTKMNVYYSEVKDAITSYTFDEVIGGDTRRISQQVNAGKSQIKGIELGLNKRLSKSWNSFINYTYTDAKLKDTEIPGQKNNIGKQLANVPENMFNIGFDYSQGAWQASLIGNYVSESNSPEKIGGRGYSYYDPYFIVNAKVTYKVNDAASISLSVDNLLNREYFAYYLAQPRTVYAELGYKF